MRVFKSSVSMTGWTGALQHPAAISLAACAVYVPLKRHLLTVPASLRPWLCCAHCAMLILHCKLATIARLWVTTWQGGSGNGTSAKSPLADLWRKMWGELDQPRWTGQFSMFKLKSHTPFDSSWTSERKRDWVGDEVAGLAAKRALEAWRSLC